MTFRKEIFCFLLLLCFSLPQILLGGSAGKVFQLENGLNLFIKEMHSSPVVAINTFVHVGSKNEKNGEEGFSHFIEHILFKGTASFPVGQLDREIKKLGASNNAFTTLDYTCFHVLGAKEHFARLLELQSDAIFHSNFPADELEKERQVILEELRMDNDDPDSFSSNCLRASAYRVHPYRHPVIGYVQSVASASRENLYDFYRKYYVPSNMWVVIVGDIQTEEAFEAVKKFFGSAPRANSPELRIPSEPKQEKRNEFHFFGDIQQTYLKMAWHVPGIESDDNFVFDIIATLMGKGRSSRLYKILVENERLASNVEASYATTEDPFLFVIEAELPQGNIRKFTERVEKLIGELKEDKNFSAELEKVKQQIVAGTIFERETAESQALAYGYYAVLGKLGMCDEYPDKIKSVTSTDIQRVVGEYFRSSNLTVVSYQPAISSSSFKPELLKLENGVRLILKENHSSPIVSVAVQVDAGGMREGKNEAGLSNLALAMLTKGTESKKAQEIAQELETMGTSLKCRSKKSFSTISMVCLTEKFWESVVLLKDILCNPTFPEEEFEKEREKALEAIKTEQDDLFYFTYYNTLSKLFPDHPLGYSPLGMESQVKKLKRSDIVHFYKKHYVGEGIVISVVGDFFINEMKEKLVNLFAEIPKGNISEVKDSRLPPIEASQEFMFQKNREQAQIVCALRTFPRSDSRCPAMEILRNILAGSMSSRLFSNLREKESLAYSVWAVNVGTVNQGYFFATLSTAVNKIDTAKNRLIEELRRAAEGFSDEEFNDAKSFLLGQYALSQIDNISQAETFSSDEFLGLGFDYSLKYPEIIKNVKKEEVLSIAKEFFSEKVPILSGITKP